MNSQNAKEAVKMSSPVLNEMSATVKEIIFQEPSDEELISFIQDIPLKQDYEQLETNYILPWSVDEVWANIFDFEAPYSFDIALSE